MTVSDIAVDPGRADVFADLGLPDTDAHIVMAELVARIDAIVCQCGITQVELDLCPLDVSWLLRGHFHEY